MTVESIHVIEECVIFQSTEFTFKFNDEEQCQNVQQHRKRTNEIKDKQAIEGNADTIIDAVGYDGTEENRTLHDIDM